MSDEKLLLSELKKAGLNIGEEAVAKVVNAVFAALPEYMAKNEKINPGVAALISGMLPVIKPHILEFVDKIDGEDDNNSEG
tara:strand:- start:3797 stop:4039 length:243 start_codon:yes stop_codon:yes gene_type:complete